MAETDVASPAPAVVPSPAPLVEAADSGEPLPEPIRRFLEATPYPSDSGRLTENHSDLIHPNSRHERSLPIPDSGPEPENIVSFLLTADRYAYMSNETAKVWLEIDHHGRDQSVRILDSSVIREGRSGDVDVALPIGLTWTGSRFETQLDLGRFGDHHGTLRVDVDFEYAPDRRHSSSLRLFLTPATKVPATFSGEIAEDLHEGSLRIRVGIQVLTPGFFRIDGNLFDPAGKPVAFAHFKGKLGHDDKSVPLVFYGKVLRDAARFGPFQVANLRGYRFIDGGHPDRERMVSSSDKYITARYALSDFTDVHHTSAHEEAMVQLMLEDVARGISLDVPGPAVLR